MIDKLKMPDDAAQIVVNSLAVDEIENVVRRAPEWLFTKAVIEFREYELPELIILDVFFLEMPADSGQPVLVSHGEEVAIEVEKRLLADLRAR